uniref:CCHC-type domain-containing protein n=1 Tax=Tanacetum cinerariifolium TaxID=118510 RepID=A0A6L2MI51_TANCI|nr:hypothetical protein [Tanacetum cinerariifolium]
MSTENGVNPPAPNPAHNSNFSLLLVLRRKRLTGPNYMDWMRNLRFTLRYENKEYVLDEQILTINNDSTQEEIKAHQKHYDDANKVSYIIASSMSPEEKARKERLDVVKSLTACKPKPGASICAFVLEMKGYFDRLEYLNMLFDAELSINIILSGKAAKGKSNRGTKRKDEYEIAPTSDPKEVVCFYCNTNGHWKRNCPKYLKDLKDEKVKKGSHSAWSKGKEEVEAWRAQLSHGTQENRAFSQFTPPRTPQLNAVVERRNRTLLDMVSKTPFEMWKGKRPSLRHIKIYGYEVYIRREAQDKLEAKSEKCLFDSRSKIDLEEIQESADEEPIVNTNTQPEVVTPIKPDDISLPICKTSGRVSKSPQLYYGFYIEDDMISDCILSGLDEPVNYKEAMMDVKTAFLNGKLTKDVFMAQPEGFENENYPKRVCKLQKAIYGLKHASRSWNLYFHEKVTQFRFSRSEDESCIYVKNSKKGNLPLHHGIKISKDLCLKTDEELDRMRRVPYALVVGSIMYVTTCTRPDVSFALSMVSQHQQNPVTWKSSKQDTVADSTCESEHIIACEASKEAIRMKNFIRDLGVVPTVQDQIKILCDNTLAVAFDGTFCLVNQDRLRPIIVDDLSKWETVGYSVQVHN